MSSTNGRIDFAARRKTIDVEVPELECMFTLRALSVEQLRRIAEMKDDVSGSIKELFYAIVDKETGQRKFTTPEDLLNLTEMSFSVGRILQEALNRLHGVTKEAVEDTVKKSEAGLSTVSASV